MGRVLLEYAAMNAPVITTGTLIENLLRDLRRPHRLDFTANELLPQLGLMYPKAEMWLDFREAMAEEERAEELRGERKWLATALRGKAISNWLTQNVANATDFEKREVTAEIERLFKNRCYDDLEEYLSDVLEHGPAKAQRRRSHTTTTIADAVWIVLTGLARFAVALAVLNIAQTQFETVVFSLLLLIYATTQSQTVWDGSIMQLTQAATAWQLLRIRRLLKDDIEPAEQEAEQEISKVNNPGYLRLLRGLSVSAVWLLAVVKLVSAVFF